MESGGFRLESGVMKPASFRELSRWAREFLIRSLG